MSLGHVTTGAELTVTLTVVKQVSANPQESVAINRITLGPATGVKQTWLPVSVPGVTVFVAMLLSGSVAVNAVLQIWVRLQTVSDVSLAQVTTGGKFGQIETEYGDDCGLEAGLDIVISPSETVI